jgi:hypothetical protein
MEDNKHVCNHQTNYFTITTNNLLFKAQHRVAILRWEYNIKNHTLGFPRYYSGDWMEMLLLILMVMTSEGVEPLEGDSRSVSPYELL